MRSLQPKTSKRPIKMLDLLRNGVVQVVLLGTMMLGLVSGVLGVFTLLRRQALIGDALSHATLPGVVLMFLFTNTRDIGVLVIGAALSAALALYLMRLIKKHSILENDAILALILSSFFGFGRFLISYISRFPEFSKVKLDDFIFGSAATMVERDVMGLVVICGIVFVLIALFWRHLKLQTFNAEFYQSLGFSNTFIEFLMSFMMILVIVSGIRSVGVILMSSLLIVPGIAARQFSHQLKINVFLAGFVGGLAAIIGTLISVSYPSGLPTGPTIVIVGTTMALLALFLAPKYGLIANEIKRQRHRKDIQQYRLLIHLYMNDTVDEPLSEILQQKDYVRIDEKSKYVLTAKGRRLVETILEGGH